MEQAVQVRAQAGVSSRTGHLNLAAPLSNQMYECMGTGEVIFRFVNGPCHFRDTFFNHQRIFLY